MERTKYFSGQDVLLEDLERDQNSRDFNLRERFKSTFTYGIIEESGNPPFEIRLNPEDNTKIDVLKGVAYDSEFERIVIKEDEYKEYDPNAPNTTTEWGQLTPQSTGNLKIPLADYTNGVINYIGIKYLSTIVLDENYSSVHVYTGNRYYTYQKDGYEIKIFTDLNELQNQGFLLLGSIKAQGAGNPPTNISYSGREYVDLKISNQDISGNVNINGSLSVKGNVYLGNDQTNDTIEIKAKRIWVNLFAGSTYNSYLELKGQLIVDNDDSPLIVLQDDGQNNPDFGISWRTVFDHEAIIKYRYWDGTEQNPHGSKLILETYDNSPDLPGGPIILNPYTGVGIGISAESDLPNNPPSLPQNNKLYVNGLTRIDGDLILVGNSNQSLNRGIYFYDLYETNFSKIEFNGSEGFKFYDPEGSLAFLIIPSDIEIYHNLIPKHSQEIFRNLGNVNYPFHEVHCEQIQAIQVFSEEGHFDYIEMTSNSPIVMGTGYSPSSDNHVATKKYVDDSISNLVINGTPGTIAKFDTSGLTDSIITESSGSITINGNLGVNQKVSTSLVPSTASLKLGSFGERWGGCYLTGASIYYPALMIGDLGLAAPNNVALYFTWNGYALCHINTTGDFIPDTNDRTTKRIGDPSNKWSEVHCVDLYAGDLHLQNDKGDWTLQEDQNEIYLINNKTGKKFKILMEEV